VFSILRDLENALRRKVVALRQFGETMTILVLLTHHVIAVLDRLSLLNRLWPVSRPYSMYAWRCFVSFIPLMTCTR